MFQFRRFPTHGYLIHHALPEVCSGGFPHSDISGSQLICSSPKLFAAYHVLHRLLMPRHSPCALLRLTFESALQFLYKLLQINPFLVSLQVSYKNYAGSHFFVSLLAKLLFTLNFCFLTVAFSYRFSFTLCSVFKVHLRAFLLAGGPKWTRTTDLTIISRVL